MDRTITPAQLQTEFTDKLILDVRRASDLATSADQLAGARWQDPEKLADWAGALPQEKEIIIYCARGGSVSNGVVDALHAKGLKARYIEGGIEGWKAAGGKVAAK